MKPTIFQKICARRHFKTMSFLHEKQQGGQKQPPQKINSFRQRRTGVHSQHAAREWRQLRRCLSVCLLAYLIDSENGLVLAV